MALAVTPAASKENETKAERECSVASTIAVGFKVAEPSERARIYYPREALDAWSEGWVLLEFAVAADGSVRDLAVVDALGPAAFVESAKNAVARYRYKPATRNGVAVDQHWSQISVAYKFEDSAREADHDAFIRLYNRARRHLVEGQYDEAIAALERGFKQRLNLYEEAMGSFVLAVAYAQKNDREHALYHVRHATIEGGYYLEKGLRANAMELEVDLEAHNGNFIEAVCDHEAMVAEPAYVPTSTGKTTADLVAKMRALLKGPEAIAVEAKLVNHPLFASPAVWRHQLLRSKFSFSDIKGEAKSFHLACFLASHDGPVDAETIWNVPPEAGPCILRVDGAPGTTFELIEQN